MELVALILGLIAIVMALAGLMVDRRDRIRARVDAPRRSPPMRGMGEAWRSRQRDAILRDAQLSGDNPCAICIRNDRSLTRVCYACFVHRHRGASRDHVTPACECTCKED